jgi:hypothetical protein
MHGARVLHQLDKPNELTKEGPLSFVFFEPPFTSVSTVSRGPPLYSLSVCNHGNDHRDAWPLPPTTRPWPDSEGGS